MPEVAEVETVRRTLESALVGRKIASAEFPPDDIVLSGSTSAEMEASVIGATVVAAHRKGKFWWLELDATPWLFGHLGMAGWLREMGRPTIRLKEHGKAPMEDATGRPRFLKMSLTTNEGRTVAMTDGRRLSRLWLAEHPSRCKNISELGHDILLEPWNPSELEKKLAGRQAPIKALLLDQSLFAGVGNWIADEALYQARISPKRSAGSLSSSEISLLIQKISEIAAIATEMGADENKYPADWLFHKRWGGKRGADQIQGHALVREAVGGRTTAWAPTLQK